MKILKWVGILVGGFISLIVILGSVLVFVGQRNISRSPEIQVGAITAEGVSGGSVEQGRYFATISACAECHGSNYEGRAFVDEAPIGYVPAPNLTSGAGGLGESYTPSDWERAIRHGVGQDGRTLVIMASDHYAHYGDEDLTDMIAYLSQLPPVDNDLGPRELMLPGNIIFGVLAYSSWPVNKIDHATVGGPAPADSTTAEYGQYIGSITSCQSCHAENYAGNYGQQDSPLGPNLTVVSDWTEAEFAAAVRTGVGRDGRALDPVEMPWPAYAALSDNDIQALYNFLSSLENLPDNESG